MLSGDQHIPTTLLTQFTEKPYYGLKMHANLLNAEKIKNCCDQNKTYDINIYNKTQERVIIQRMRRGDICLIIQTQPKHYSGAIAIVQVVDIKLTVITVSFLRYLQRKISIEDLKKLDPVFNYSKMIITIPEKLFNRIIQMEDVKTLVIDRPE
ncbi:Conserved_hypothetical protein [Hexamita inflata]|uniref:Uncharacterized protein n=1 Tax=Hexamita inflata TaxID=28002 RepID=A0AA86QGP0_9EUKA|nr:Conserved hypothetical protein [Hexamita inflata]